jgi:hypothetical protein
VLARTDAGREIQEMFETDTIAPAPQRLRALAQANKVRLARAELKRRIADGETSAAEVILTCPLEVHSWSIGELLTSQRRWGAGRCRKFLAPYQISEVKRIGTLTERQRRLLAAKLRSCESVAELPPAVSPTLELAAV